jgi:hypothetical protein
VKRPAPERRDATKRRPRAVASTATKASPAAYNKAKSGGHYDVVVANPTTGFVSLRLVGFDAYGSKVEQTLIKAYADR